MRNVVPLALVFAAAVAPAQPACADWKDPISGATTILPTHFEPGDGTLTVHASPRREPSNPDASPFHWSQPLVDRHLDTSVRFAPLAAELLETINRVEPIYDPTLLEGPNYVVPLRIYAGTAEMRDIFADHWRLGSADANVDADIHPIANAWTPGSAPRPCGAYRVRRRHEWREPALSAPTVADCRALGARQVRGFADAAPIPVAIAAPPIPVFAAPEPGSRMSSTDFWAAQRARIGSIQAHLNRKWFGTRTALGSNANERLARDP